MKDPANDLERALAVALRGPEGHPEFFRQARESILVFLVPYHPELDGTFTIRNGDAMTFTVWENPKGKFIPIFTSIERAQAAIKNTGARENQYAVAEMKGKELFRAIACQEYGVVINPASGKVELSLDRRAARMLADGTILRPIPSTAQQQGRVKIVEPADYPTDFLQPLFRFLGGRPEVKAAWLFRQIEQPDPARINYVFGLLVACSSTEQLLQDFAVVAKSATRDEADFGVTIINSDEPAVAEIISRHPAFYAAPDYKAPSPLRE